MHTICECNANVSLEVWKVIANGSVRCFAMLPADLEIVSAMPCKTCSHVQSAECTIAGWWFAVGQQAADVWKKDVWDFQAFSQTFLELRFSLGNEGKGDKNLNSQT